MDKLHIFKIGGGLLSDEKLMASALSSFHALVGYKILIHGGGKQANELCEKLGIQPNMYNGRRITDNATLDVAVMVYAGLANKKVVAKLQQFGTNAIGLSGADANVIRATKRPVQDIDYGWAGDIKSVDINSLKNIFTPQTLMLSKLFFHDNINVFEGERSSLRTQNRPKEAPR